MPMQIAILEDNEDRREEMAVCLKDRFPQYPVQFFATAAETIRFLRLHLDDCLLIGLDHDLDLIEGANGQLFDPGSGRDVADYLATRRPTCPVTIHTTNVPAAEGMRAALEEAGWATSQVVPYGDREWIGQLWLRTVRNAVVRDGVALQARPGLV
jgi:hypothetical protein